MRLGGRYENWVEDMRLGGRYEDWVEDMRLGVSVQGELVPSSVQ